MNCKKLTKQDHFLDNIWLYLRVLVVILYKILNYASMLYDTSKSCTGVSISGPIRQHFQSSEFRFQCYKKF